MSHRTVGYQLNRNLWGNDPAGPSPGCEPPAMTSHGPSNCHLPIYWLVHTVPLLIHLELTEVFNTQGLVIFGAVDGYNRSLRYGVGSTAS